MTSSLSALVGKVFMFLASGASVTRLAFDKARVRAACHSRPRNRACHQAALAASASGTRSSKERLRNSDLELLSLTQEERRRPGSWPWRILAERR